MSNEFDFSTGGGLFKSVYAKTLKNVRPSCAVVQRMFPFDTKAKVGKEYRFGVELQPPNGWTLLGSGGTAQTLNTQRNAKVDQAVIAPFEFNLRERISYAVFSRAEAEGEAAFKDAWSVIPMAMNRQSANVQEIVMLRGQVGIGTVASVTDLGSSTADIFITPATFAPGIFWALGKGAPIDSITTNTLNNASGALILQSVTVDATNPKITVTYSGTLASECAANDVLYLRGGHVGAGSAAFNEMPGLIAQAKNLTGTSLGLSASTYPNWAGNTYDAAGNISHAVVEDALSRLRDRLVEGSLVLMIGNKGYSQLVVELAAMRVLDDSYTNQMAKQGFKAVGYSSPEVGDVQIINHPFLAWGEFLVVPKEEVIRAGSSDLAFDLPGSKGERFFQYIADTNAVELQQFCDQFIGIQKPSWSMYGTGITYT